MELLCFEGYTDFCLLINGFFFDLVRKPVFLEKKKISIHSFNFKVQAIFVKISTV